jgi:hypothetical protein
LKRKYEILRFAQNDDVDFWNSLAKGDINKAILFHVLSDNLEFGKVKKIYIEELFSLWTKPTKSKQAEYKRRKFIIETLKEIEQLSGGTFRFDIDKNSTIIAKRIPDRNSTTKAKKIPDKNVKK